MSPQELKNRPCGGRYGNMIEAGAASTVHAFASDKAVARAGPASHVRISGHPRDFQESHEKFGSSVALTD